MRLSTVGHVLAGSLVAGFLAGAAWLNIESVNAAGYGSSGGSSAAANITGTLPVAHGGTGLTALGTGVATAFGVNIGAAGAIVTNSGTAAGLTAGAVLGTGVPYGTSSNTAAQGNDSRITGAAPAASPTFTGTVTMPDGTTWNSSNLSVLNLAGPLNGQNFGQVALWSAVGTGNKYETLSNTGGNTRIGTENNVGNTLATGAGPYTSVFGSNVAASAYVITNGIVAIAADTNQRIFLPSASSSGSAQTSYWCGDANKQLIADSVGCVVSSARFKDIGPKIRSATALAEVLSLTPVSFHFKPAFNGKFQTNPNFNGEKVGLIAEDVTKIDKRCTGWDETKGAGKTPHNWEPDCVIALLVGAVQEQHREIAALQKASHK